MATETAITTDAIAAALNGSSDAYMMRVVENNGYYDITSGLPTYWDDVRDDVEIVRIVDSPLMGWETETTDIEMDWTGTNPESPRSVVISWDHAVEITDAYGSYVAFVGFGEMEDAR